MRRIALLLVLLPLSACGLKDDLFLPAPPAEPARVEKPAPEPEDQDRATKPKTPDPTQAQ